MSKIEFAEQLKSRTKKFAIEIIKLCKDFPQNSASFVVSKQLIKASTSVASNYRAACRARSTAEFYAKICIVTEEADETVFWLEITIETDIINNSKSIALLKESNELLAIFSKSKKTAKNNQLINY